MSKRKSFEVEAFKKFVNEQLKRTDEHAMTGNFKSALCVALGEVLHKSGNYNGFMHLYWDERGCSEWRANGCTEVWSEKKLYILGSTDSKYKGDEYARRYY